MEIVVLVFLIDNVTKSTFSVFFFFPFSTIFSMKWLGQKSLNFLTVLAINLQISLRSCVSLVWPAIFTGPINFPSASPSLGIIVKNENNNNILFIWWAQGGESCCVVESHFQNEWYLLWLNWLRPTNCWHRPQPYLGAADTANVSWSSAP